MVWVVLLMVTLGFHHSMPLSWKRFTMLICIIFLVFQLSINVPLITLLTSWLLILYAWSVHCIMTNGSPWLWNTHLLGQLGAQFNRLDWYKLMSSHYYWCWWNFISVYETQLLDEWILCKSKAAPWLCLFDVATVHSQCYYMITNILNTDIPQWRLIMSFYQLY